MGAVVVTFVMVCVGSAWAQYPWQVKDVVACYTGGKCNVFRIDNTDTINFLNSLDDGLSGDVHGAVNNNSLHLLVTDGGSASNVVQFTIASINPFDGSTVPHTTTTFPSSGGNNSNNAQAIAINANGHMFVGNSGSGGNPQASIVELDAHGAPVTGSVFTFPTSNDPCATTVLNSVDLSAAGDAIYVTAGDGKIRKVGPIGASLSTASCTVFADFGPGVQLFGIKDVPSGALAGNCPPGGCPGGETVLVVATGSVDIDTGETEENPNSDAVNICTNATGSNTESCALLLSTQATSPSLAGPKWAANNPYASTGTEILDAFLHLQMVVSAGTSSTDEPAWSQSGLTVRDNAVVWKDLGKPVQWLVQNSYSAGQLTIGAGHVQQETLATCTSGLSTPSWNTGGGTTPDGTCSWTDLGISGTWAPTTAYVTNNTPYTGQLVTAGSGNVQQVQIAGTSGPGPNPPAFSTTGGTVTDGLQWQDQGALSTVIARYRTGQTGLQALALDPLVADCTGSCSSLPLPTRTLANFWLASSGFGNIFKMSFANTTGPSDSYDTNSALGCPNGACGVGIRSMNIYGGEAAAQPGLASLLVGGSLVSPNFTATQTILGNTITSTLYGATSSTPISLYASLVPTVSCFNDANVGNLPCRATVTADTTKSLVWKIDIPQGRVAALPKTQVLNTAFSGPLANPPSTPSGFGIDNGTDVFVDMGFDDTTFVLNDPGTRTVSVHSLHEIQTTFSQAQSQCTFSSPLANTCYKLNRTTLNFTFSCSGLSPTQLASLNPALSLVKKNSGQAPQFIPIGGTNATNGKPAFRFDKPHNIWTYQLNLSGFAPGFYLGTAQDNAFVVQSFTTGQFQLDPTCK
jgi:hypothetical protein